MRLLIVLMITAAAQGQVFHDGRVPREGFDLYYRAAGAGRYVAILSGGPGFDCDYMLPVAREVGKENQAILIELRGTGRSRPMAVNGETVNLKAYTGDLDAVRRHLGIDRWTLLGHSAGALLAMHYAAAHPEHVDTLVLVGSGPIATAHDDAAGDNARMRLLPSERKDLEQPNLSFEAGIRLTLPGQFFDRSKAAEMAAGFRPDSLHRDVMGLLLKELLPPDGDLRPALRSFARPVLVVAGRQDPHDPHVQHETHRAFQKSTLRFIPRCGHFPWIEQPSQFYSIVREFLGTAAAAPWR
ncbi:MAG: alpha/beta hydrolase [Acidobacteria bacterium]|nr:alpha/beta hydrolase [Acidobacteriota bacterium]